MPNTQNVFQNDIWNPWTSKSSQVAFKSTLKSVGDGEQKIAAEFDTFPLGQNVSYDLYINDEKWEIKKLDSDNSFRLGVNVSTNYTKIISAVIRIIEKIDTIYDKLIESQNKQIISEIKELLSNTSSNSSTKLLDGLRKNEVSASNLEKANSIIDTLKAIKVEEDASIQLYNSYSGTLQNYNLKKAFNKLLEEDLSPNEISDILGSPDIYNNLLILKDIENDLSIFKKNSLKEILNKIVRYLFSGEIKLILVHEKYGFKPITELNSIYCNRITSGNPRCKII